MKENLAIDGGHAAIPADLVKHDWQRFRKASQEEIDAVVEVLKSGHLSIALGKGMPNAEGLEREFAKFVGCTYALAVNTGTAALHCAIAGAGVNPGDEVLVPAYTFVASAMAVLHQNAIPVFVDIDPDTFVMDATLIEEKITSKTKAIMPVHIYGLACDMNQINKIARKHNLKVIEDAAQAYGTIYEGKKAGNLGDAAGFAMTTTKQLMTGEGGIMTTNDPDIYERAAMLRLFGERGDMNSPDRAYISDGIGWNYKIAELISALARVKVRHLHDFVSGIQSNAEYLSDLLLDIKGLQRPVIPAGREHAYYMYPVRVKPQELNLDIEPERLRNAVLKALAAENVLVGLWQKAPVPAQTVFQRKDGYGNGCPWTCNKARDVDYDPLAYPNTIKILQDHFVVRGMFPPHTKQLMECYSKAFKKVFANIEKVIDIYNKTEKYIPLEEKLYELTGRKK